MQIFLPYKNIFETARCLDKRRLHKQIIECMQILNVYEGKSKAWYHHPVVLMYQKHVEFVQYYMYCLIAYKDGRESDAFDFARHAENKMPDFISDEYCDNFKRRLYDKDSEFYKKFENFGHSYENWYYVNNEWKIYKQK